MNKNIYLIGGSALVLGGLYLAYKKGVFGAKPITPADVKNEQELQAEKDALLIIANKQKASSNLMSNPNSYKAKVSVLQQALGVAADGIPGPQTLKALQKHYPNVTKITPEIVDQVLPFIKANGVMPNPSLMKLTVGSGFATNTGVVNPLDLMKY